MNADRLMAECRSDRERFRRVCKDYIDTRNLLAQATGTDDPDEPTSALAGTLIGNAVALTGTLEELRSAVRDTHDSGDCQCREDWTSSGRRVVTIGSLCKLAGIEDA